MTLDVDTTDKAQLDVTDIPLLAHIPYEGVRVVIEKTVFAHISMCSISIVHHTLQRNALERCLAIALLVVLHRTPLLLSQASLRGYGRRVPKFLHRISLPSTRNTGR
jgi:hypothetical protein